MQPLMNARSLRASLCLFAAFALGACAPPEGESPAEPRPRESPPTATSTEEASEADTPAEGRREAEPVLAFLGDSLTAGYGLPEDAAFPALLEARFDDAGLPVAIVNAGVSGDTSAGGLRRIDWVLRARPDVVVIGLGGNDGLRALPTEAMEDNLRGIVRKAREAGAEAVLLGMQMPPSHGADYRERFAAVFPRLAEELDLAFVPFMLEGVGGVPEMNLPDGIHPNRAGQERVADHVEAVLRPLVERWYAEREEGEAEAGAAGGASRAEDRPAA